MKYVATLPYEMQTFENDTNCPKITTKTVLEFYTGGNVVGSTSYQSYYIICSK